MSSQQPVKIKVWFNLKKLRQKYITLCDDSTSTTHTIIKTLFLKKYLPEFVKQKNVNIQNTVFLKKKYIYFL